MSQFAAITGPGLLTQLVHKHLQEAGIADVARHAKDFVELVRTEQAKPRPGTDAFIWGSTSMSLPGTTDEREILARQLVAILRRVRDPHLRTWAPGDPLPATPPATMGDLDGAIWIHQQHAGRGCYRMSAKDRRKYNSPDLEGVHVWPTLLVREGPFSARVHLRPGGGEA